jgi:hypothetical protein
VVVYLGSERWATLYKKFGVQNRSVFKKLKFSNFSNPPFGKRADHPLGKSLTFLESNFLANGIDNPPSNLT